MAKLGSSFLLKCPIEKKVDQIFWYKSAKRVTDLEQVDLRDIFINKTRKEDAGLYECITDDYTEVHKVNLVLSGKIKFQNCILLNKS